VNNMNLDNRLLGSSMLNMLEHAVKFAAMFLVTPALIGGLGKEQYGLWLLLMTFFSYYSLLDLGIGIASVRFMSRALGDSGDDVARVADTCRRFFRRISLASVMLSLVALASVYLIFEPSENAFNAQLVIAVCGFGISIRFLLMICQVMLKSHLRYEVIAFSSIGRVILQSLLVIGCVRAGYGLVVIAVVVSFCDLLQQVAQYFFARPLLKSVRSSDQSTDSDLGSRLIRYSLTSFGMRLSITLKDRIDPYLIGGLLGVSVVPLYSVGTRFLFLAGDVINALFGGQFLAAFSRMDGAGNQEAMRAKFLSSLRFCAAVAAFISSALVIQGGVFIERWIGSDFSGSYDVLLIIAFPYALFMMQYPSLSLVSSMNRHSHVTRITALGSVVNVALSVVLGIYFGFRGVAWATAIDLCIVYLILFPRTVCIQGAIPGWSYCRALCRGALPVFSGMYGCYVLSRGLLEPTYSRILMLGLLHAGCFCLIFWSFVLTGSERAWVTGRFKRRGCS
jgi:O-antigen/teichoic acid export membrane protein